MEHINWYPGHMKKTQALIRENLKMVDAVVELWDARIPESSRNPVIDQLVGQKPRIVVLNKEDLADEKENRVWIRHLQAAGLTAMTMNCMRGKGIKELMGTLGCLKTRRTGNRAAKPFRIMVVGVPNVGKSSLINRLTGRRSARTGDRPGVTRGKQWLTMKNGMQMLDTPGILWPKFQDRKVGLHLAFCGAVRDEILDTVELGAELIRLLAEEYPELLKERYRLERIPGDGLAALVAVAKNRGFVMAGGRIDYERCARTLLDEFRSAKIGRITLEKTHEDC